MKRNRLTSNDSTFGPLTLGERSKSWRPWGAHLDSGDGDEYAGCSLNVQVSGWWLRINLPPLIKPWRQWVDTSGYAWASERGGYWDSHARRYGFTLSEGFLQVFLGPQTHDSTTTRSWNTHLPWTQWRHVRFSLYGLRGEHFWTEPSGRQVPKGDAWRIQQEKRDECPKAVFEVEDYDGARILATTRIEEREWRAGEGWFKWLSWFRAPKIKRSLDISFNHEVGYEKGSWKGGLMGTGIELEPGELHESAMRRFCAAGVLNKGGISALKFIGLAGGEQEGKG